MPRPKKKIDLRTKEGRKLLGKMKKVKVAKVRDGSPGLGRLKKIHKRLMQELETTAPLSEPLTRQLSTPERARCYTFPMGQGIVIPGVVAAGVRPNGMHRLELDNGNKVIVNTGWMAIEIDTDEWSF